MSLSKCPEYYRIYEDLDNRILSLLRIRGSMAFDSLREELEREGIYMDSRCLRKRVADMVRTGRIAKKLDPVSRKLLLTIKEGQG